MGGGESLPSYALVGLALPNDIEDMQIFSKVQIFCVYGCLVIPNLLCHFQQFGCVRSVINIIFLKLLWVVPQGGFEPPRPKAEDFESTKSTSSITAA